MLGLSIHRRMKGRAKVQLGPDYLLQFLPKSYLKPRVSI